MLFLGCVSFQKKENILALVDNDPITRGDLVYSIQVEHRREGLSSADKLDISQFIQKQINDRLIVHEAYRMGLDKEPGIRNAVRSYITRESVVKLHREDILQKISITDQDIKQYYKENYKQFFLGVIEFRSEEEALDVLERVKENNNFMKLADEYPSRFQKNDSGEVVLTKSSMSSKIVDIISDMKTGQTSGVFSINNSYYIIKLIRIKDPSDESFPKFRNSIVKTLMKERENELSQAYFEYLRKKIPNNINREILSFLLSEENADKLDELVHDKRTLAEAADSILTVGQFLITVKKTRGMKPSEQMIDNWINTKLVDHEALSRHYEKSPDLMSSINNYRHSLLKKYFINRVINPMMIISDDELKDYYQKNLKDYLNPARYKIQQITVKNMDDASYVIDALRDGASFSWLAKMKSTDIFAGNGGLRGWVTSEEVPATAKSILDTLDPGDLSPALPSETDYIIIRMREKIEEKAKDFNVVRDDVYRAYASKKFNEIYSNVIETLKKEARVKIYDDAVNDFKKNIAIKQ
jgi:parvulin-like peptidyl-prolyl isomerase